MRKTTRLPGWLAAAGLLLVASPADAGDPIELGVGMVNPPVDPGRPLYFYMDPPLNQYPPTVTPSDSLTFRTGDHFIDIGTAPPWFVPETMKLDYDLLYLRAVSISSYWIEVVVNESPERPRSFPRTAWVARESVAFRTWTAFLLEVYSVETLDPAANPLRSGPGEEFPSTGPSEGIELRVLVVQGSWARVEGADGNESDPHRGWIRWRDGDTLSISYSLLS